LEKVQYFSFLSEIGKIGKSLVFFRKKTAIPLFRVKEKFSKVESKRKGKGAQAPPLYPLSYL
jgi:hypothetical protein